MIKNTLIIILLLLVIYLYYQNRNQSNTITGATSELREIANNQNFSNFLQTNLGSKNLEELKTKLGEKTLDELLEANEDYETEVDTLTRTKNSLEQDLLAQSNSFQNRLREKDREVKKFKENLESEKKRADKTQQSLTSEKQQHKGSLERITKLTEQIGKLEKEKQDLNKKPLVKNEAFQVGVGWANFYHWLTQTVYQLSSESKIEKVRENELTENMKQVGLLPNSADQTFLDNLRLTVEGTSSPTDLFFPVYQTEWTFEQYFDSDKEPFSKTSKRYQRIKFLFEKWKESLA